MNDLAYPQFLEWRPWVLGLGLLFALSGLQRWWSSRRAVQTGLGLRFGGLLSLPRALLKAGLWTAAAWYLLLALATPLGPAIRQESAPEGADLVLAVDVSSSMYAQDLAPDRLRALKAALLDLVGRLEGDRVGIVAFAGQAVIACPFTSDIETASLFIERLESDSVPEDGTGLGNALKLALDGFAAEAGRGRMIVLATDGEDTRDSDALAQAKRAKEAGVPVYTLGVGSPQGAYIPDRPDIFGRVRAKTYQGRPILTKMDPEGLKRIAQAGGGEYLAGPTPESLRRAYARVRELKKGLGSQTASFSREPLYQEPLRLAFLLLLLEALISAERGAWRRGAAALGQRLRARFQKGAPAGLLIALGLASSLSAASWDGGRSQHDQGNRAYRQGDFTGASKLYESAAQDDPTRPSSHYNLGNAKFQQGDYEGAIGAYESTLSLDPSDADARHNLELAQKRLQQSQQQGDKKDGKGDKQGGQKNGPGQSSGQQGQAQPGQSGSGLKVPQGMDPDKAAAMLNMLKQDQKRYQGYFNPLKKRDKPEESDPMQQMLEQMGMRPKREPVSGSAPEKKNW